jgi:hypothetical protein
MTSSKMPKQMPISVLSQTPNKVFLEQTGFLAHSSSKIVSAKTETKGEGDL